MNLACCRLIVAGSVLLASMSDPPAVRAQQPPSIGISNVRPARAVLHRSDPKLDPQTCPQLSRTLHCPPIGHPKNGTITEFDVPGAISGVSVHCGQACGTMAYGINASGTIVGWYEDRDIVPHGFLRDRTGAYLTIDAPGAAPYVYEGTVAYAINDAGNVTGQYEDANTIHHGYVREANGTFEEFSAPGAGKKPGLGTFAWTIDSHGDTAGMYYDDNRVRHGFVRSPDHHIATFDPPGSVDTFVCFETCVSDVGTVGIFRDRSAVQHGFLRRPNGKILVFDAPGAGESANQGTDFQTIIRPERLPAPLPTRTTSFAPLSGIRTDRTVSASCPVPVKAPLKVPFRKASMRSTR